MLVQGGTRRRLCPAARGNSVVCTSGEALTMKPFTTIAALILLIAAAVHAWRFFTGAIAVSVAGHVVPVWASAPGAVLAAFLGVALLMEARR